MKNIKYHLKENATKFAFPSFLKLFLMNIYVNVTYWFFFSFHHIIQLLSYLNQLDFDFDYTSQRYNH